MKLCCDSIACKCPIIVSKREKSRAISMTASSERGEDVEGNFSPFSFSCQYTSAERGETIEGNFVKRDDGDLSN